MGVHDVVGVGGGVVVAPVLVGDDDGLVVVGCLDAGTNDVGGAVVAGGGVEGLEEVGDLVAVLVVEAAHRQLPNREFHFCGSSDGQLHRQSAAETQAPVQAPS